MAGGIEDRVRALENRLERLDVYEQALQDAIDRAVAAVGERAAELESRVSTIADRSAIVAELAALIRSDPHLRELLRGPRGIPGLDGNPGPPGDAGATVIRERTISG